jgi:hypothetical protein
MMKAQESRRRMATRGLLAVLWIGFALSAIAVAALWRSPPGEAPAPTGDTSVAPERRPGESLDPVPAPADEAPPEESPAAGEVGIAPAASPEASGTDPSQKDSPEEAGGGSEDAEAPETFIAGLLDLARKGDADEIMARVLPGFMKAAGEALLPIILQQGPRKEDEPFPLDLLEFGYERLPDGLVRLQVSGPPGAEVPDVDFFLIPHEGSWKLGTASDIPGMPEELCRTALDRLRLLALSQFTYLEENLGTRPGFAPTVRELAEGLGRSPDYAGVLAPRMAAAVDDGGAAGGYWYGRLQVPAGAFAYYAVPIAPNAETRETLIIDASGSVWGKDLGGAPPPAEWPAEPEKDGWERKVGQWPKS